MDPKQANSAPANRELPSDPHAVIDSDARPSPAPGLLFGIGLGGFVDGIVLHQVLQWHHMVSADADHPVKTVAGLEVNTMADGFWLRSIEDEPIALETTYFPAVLTPGLLDHAGDGSLWQELRERYDIRPHESRAVLEAIVLDEESCDLLGVRSASSGILLTRTTVDPQGRAIEYARDIYRADRAAFEVTAPVAP